MIKLIALHLNALKEFLPAIFEPLVPAVLLGIFFSWRQRRDAGYFLLLGCFAMALTIRLFWGVGVTRYYAFSSVFGVIFSATGFYFLRILLRKYVSRRISNGIISALIVGLTVGCIIRVFTFHHSKPFLREYGEAIVKDCSKRGLQFPRVLVANKIGIYLEYYHQMKSNPILLMSDRPIDLRPYLDEFDGIYDGVYLVLNFDQTPKERLDIVGNRDSKLIYQTKNHQKYVSVYFLDYNNIGQFKPLDYSGAESLSNGDFEQFSATPPSHANQIVKRGYSLPMNRWPTNWNVNAAHYWEDASASPDAGIFMVGTDLGQSMQLRSRDRITVINDTPIRFKDSIGIEFMARGTPGTVFRVFFFGKEGQRYVFYCSRTLSVMDSWHHHHLTWSQDFEKLSDAKFAAFGKVGLVFKHGNAEFDQFKIIPSSAMRHE